MSAGPPTLTLLNGALALDLDGIKHSLGGWDEDLTLTALRALLAS